MMHHLMTDAGILYINPDGKPAALVFAPEHMETQLHGLLAHMIRPVVSLELYRRERTATLPPQCS